MKIRDLSMWEAFYWTAREKHFTKAADRLGVSTAQLSKRVSGLEEVLGIRLLDRTTRKIGLTQEGQSLLPSVEVMLNDLENLENQYVEQRELSGKLRITCVTAFAHRHLARLVTEFVSLHPKVSFEIEPTDQLLDLIEHQFDIGIRASKPRGSDYICKRLLENKLVLCASPSYLKRSKTIRRVEDLTQHSTFGLHVYRDCQIKGSELSVGDLLKNQNLVCENGMFLTQLALNGAGVAVRSLWDVSAFLESGELVEVLKGHSVESYQSMYAVTPSRRLMSKRVRAFMDFLSERSNSLQS